MIYKYLGKIEFEPQGFIADDYFSNNGDSILINEMNHPTIKEIKMYQNNVGDYALDIEYLDGTTFTDYEQTYELYQALLFSKLGAMLEVIGKIVFTTDNMRLDFVNDFCKPLVNCIFLYRLNSPKNKVEKDLIFVSCSEVKYNRPITYKQIQLDMKKGASDEFFNYVYLSVLNRYYFVTDSVLTNDFYSLQLTEDVLSSFGNLIYSQTAFVERSESSYEQDKVDDLVVYDYDKAYTYTALTPSVTLYATTDTQELTRRSCVIITVATP